MEKLCPLIIAPELWVRIQQFITSSYVFLEGTIGSHLYKLFIIINDNFFSFNYQHGLVNSLSRSLLMTNCRMCTLTFPVKEMDSRNTLADDTLFWSSEVDLFKSLSYVWKYSDEIWDNRLITEEEGGEICTILPLTSCLPNKLNTLNKFILILEYT